jgi:O-antigen ligase
MKKTALFIQSYLVLLLLSLAVDVKLLPIPALRVDSLPLNLLVTMAGAIFPLVFFQDCWRFIRENKLILATLFLFLCSGVVSAAASPFPMMAGLKWLFRYAQFIGTACLLLFLFSRDKTLCRFFLKAVIGVALLLGLISVIEVSLEGVSQVLAETFRSGERQVFNGWTRCAATLPHPNIFGCYMAIGILLLLHLSEHKKIHLGIFLPGLLLLSLALGLSSSRNAILTLLIPMGLLMCSRLHIKRKLLTLLISLLIFTVLTPAGPRLAQLVTTKNLPQKTAAIQRPEPTATGKDAAQKRKLRRQKQTQQPPPPNTVKLRIMLGQSAVDMFQDHPLFGIGPGGYNQALKDYAPPALLAAERDKINHNYLNAHNGPLNILAEFGLVGTGCMLFLILVQLAKLVRKNGLWPPTPALAILLALALSFIPDAFFYNPFYMVLSLTLFLVFTQPGMAGLPPAAEKTAAKQNT